MKNLNIRPIFPAQTICCDAIFFLDKESHPLHIGHSKTPTYPKKENNMKTFEPSKLVQQMIDFQKTAFDNTFNAILMIQGQTEKMTEAMLTKNSMIPEEGQKMLQEWTLAFKKGQEDFKKNIDENFKKFESFIAESASKVEKATGKTTK